MTPSPPKKSPVVMTPKKCPQFHHTPKKYSFLKTPQNTEIQMSEPQKWSQPKYT